jgi:phenylalanyl-tRNA synthetase beta chain
MKLSFSWICDHLEQSRHNFSVPDIVTALNESTAEVEKVTHSTLHLTHLFLAQVTRLETSDVELYIPELAQSKHLAYRPDLLDGHYVLIAVDEDQVRWAQMRDIGGSKDSVLPHVHTHEGVNPRNWRQSVETEDHIIDIDNKSITHRPDLWSHRGFARELAVLFDWRLKPLEEMLSPVEMQEFSGTASAASRTAPTLTIHEKSACRRLAAAFVSTIAWSPTRIPMMVRLSRVDSRSINALVDCTNYVMFDIGQPMHAFDAVHVRDHQLSVRKARTGETLRLLDGELLTLTPDDVVVADSAQPLSLAGIMGGGASGVSPETMTLLLESGSFDPVMVRHAIVRHKKRTDAATRFEKDLDPNQVVDAIRRYLYLLGEQDIAHSHDASVVVVGTYTEPIIIDLLHTFLEQRLGTTLNVPFVINRLESLGFGVTVHETAHAVQYSVKVPSYRATKDVRTKEDIVEEIGRLWGYKNIDPRVPLRPSLPANCAWVYRQRMIKNIVQGSLCMREIRSYAFFDEEWLQRMQWQPHDALEVQQPVSKNWTRLATTLMPHLYKAVCDNVEHHNVLRFFEYGRVWKQKQPIVEINVLTGILYDAQGIDFYAYKAVLELFFAHMRVPVTWRPARAHEYPWFLPYQTADIFCNDIHVGVFGLVDPLWSASMIPRGSLAIFELNDTALFLCMESQAIMYEPISKYPDIQRDMSFLVPLQVTAEQLKKTIATVDVRILNITLVDFYKDEEWRDKKSLTFSFTIRDLHKTLTGTEADTLCTNIASTVRALGAEVR